MRNTQQCIPLKLQLETPYLEVLFLLVLLSTIVSLSFLPVENQ